MARRRLRNRDRLIRLTGPGWRSPEVTVAITRRARRRGLRSTSGAGVMLWTRSVHGFGLKVPVRLVRLDATGLVIETRRLDPGRVVVNRRAAWVLELPADLPPPQRGRRLKARSTLAP